MEIHKAFTFEAAHHLPYVPRGHKCARVHGHTYRVVVHLEGDVDAHLGWVVDFATITVAMASILARLDHHDLNAVAGLDNPTAEAVAVWIWGHLHLDGLRAIDVYETATAGVTYRGPT